ncbi:MarR family winged helix-turn-helix transcriptional regulator [Herbidospora sp. RD11066]
MERPKLGHHLKRVEQALIAHKAVRMRALGITESQCEVLGLLAGGPAKSSTQLAREALVTSQTITGIVQNLEAKGLVERRPSPDHGRVMLVSLTEAGVEKEAAARGLALDVEARLRAAMTEEDFARLLALLTTAADAVDGLSKPGGRRGG